MTEQGRKETTLRANKAREILAEPKFKLLRDYIEAEIGMIERDVFSKLDTGGNANELTVEVQGLAQYRKHLKRLLQKPREYIAAEKKMIEDDEKRGTKKPE